ncbi:MAG TPA: hypothetical protein PLZ55_03875 [bacterium]|nr:hypothetical protein [bacterium]
MLLISVAWLAAMALPVTGHCEVTNAEPGAIAIDHDPQLFVDDYLVDNFWGLEYPAETMTRVFHQPQKDEHNPVIAGDGGYVNVIHDEASGLFRMWYQEYWDQSLNPRKYTYATAYAESEDGIHWKLPVIGKYSFKGTRDNNIVHVGPSGGDAEGQFLLDLPQEQRRGYRYVMLYLTYESGHRGLHLIGSQNGIDWDSVSDVCIAPDFLPDTQNSIVWDTKLQKYVCFTRAVNIYSDGKSGPRRRIARMEHSKLWEEWPVFPENIVLPDSLDNKNGNDFFYGMPVKYYAGIYWGFLWPFPHYEDIYTELAFSRDGRNFQRLPDRPRLIDVGPEGAWDHGMVFGSRWVEVGDQWWLYYSGTDKGHKSHEVKPGIGLARVRKEGFVSLRSPTGGGVVVTRLLRWPGGRFYVNADAGLGELTVRITDYDRKPISGFDPNPSLPVTGDSVRHEIKWKDGDIRSLEGHAIRLEFSLKNVVDLYGFRAVPEGQQP